MPTTSSPVTVEQLLKMSREELDDLFKAHTSGPIPDGQGKGTAIIAPGTAISPAIAEFVSFFAWEGKTFDAAHGVLTNRLTHFGINAIVAEVYKGKSLLDGKECIVLDYSKTSIVAGWIRDEIRQIQPGLYLGKVYKGQTHLIDFCLQFPNQS